MKKYLYSGIEHRYLKIQTIIFLLVFLVVLASLLLTNMYISQHVATRTNNALKEKITDIARMTAQSRIVIEGLEDKSKESLIQTYANEAKDLTNVSFIVVLDMNLIRKSHPWEDEVGKSFINRADAARAFDGKEHYSIENGRLGRALRVFTPVWNDQGKQIGIVNVGVSVDSVQEQVKNSQNIIFVAAAFGALIGFFGAMLVGRYIKKIMFGLEPIEIATMLTERSTMLQSVKEGIIAVNNRMEITLVNKEALRLMGREDENLLIGTSALDYMPVFSKVLRSGKTEMDFEQELLGSTVFVNCAPIVVNGQIVGGIATLRDKSEVKQLAEQLTGVKLYSESLRAQSHEFMNKLHVILGMVHLKYYNQLDDFITSMVKKYQFEVGYIVQRVKDPVMAGFLLGKISEAREMDINFIFSEESYIPNTIDAETIHELVTILGNLIENAFEAVSDSTANKTVSLYMSYSDEIITAEVEDSGKGIEENQLERIFTKGVSTKGDKRGYGLFLVRQSINKLNGTFHLKTKVGSGTKFTVTIPYKEKGENK
ncbi:DcuS/MalK family sensor histidine kinase [Bacillaceae bacterium Marseille-Q3522]|nr:DcuS/MalK family sensor histidine kinase [Bacillaceae bacterium Marseille-Q3522]